jgi:hypothetical protein
MHVQVVYQGPPTEFAWIVPVSDAPELFVSNDALFNVLQGFTRPTFDLWYEATGECQVWMWDDAVNANGLPSPPPPNEGGEVTVVSQQQVGPYDTVVLTANDEGALITWLQDNGYQIPDALESVLAPYVANRRHFVALRLSSGNDTGDLVPLGMRYPGTQPSIPIQLTSVAATPDMQLVTYVLGDARAVPTNYLHVELNEAAIDWFSYGTNYLDVLSRAADEAGGHAFATEFAGSTQNLRGSFLAAFLGEPRSGVVHRADGLHRAHHHERHPRLGPDARPLPGSGADPRRQHRALGLQLPVLLP